MRLDLQLYCHVDIAFPEYFWVMGLHESYRCSFPVVLVLVQGAARLSLEVLLAQLPH